MSNTHRNCARSFKVRVAFKGLAGENGSQDRDYHQAHANQVSQWCRQLTGRVAILPARRLAVPVLQGIARP